jgi:hypothetical protein
MKYVSNDRVTGQRAEVNADQEGVACHHPW